MPAAQFSASPKNVQACLLFQKNIRALVLTHHSLRHRIRPAAEECSQSGIAGHLNLVNPRKG